MSQFDIIIPHYGVSDRITQLASACLASIREHSSTEDYRVILVDNGSPQFGAIEPCLRTVPHLLIHNRVNQGFITATNQGIWSATAPYVVLMNNDTEAAPGWLPMLKRPLTGPVGISGPLTTTRGSWQGRWRPGMSPIGDNCNAYGDIVLQSHRMLAFFCAMFKREVFERCGVLDRDFGAGLGDDDAMSARAHRLGFRLALVPQLTIVHNHRTTFHALHTPEQVREMQMKALDLFHQKVKQGTV